MLDPREENEITGRPFNFFEFQGTDREWKFYCHLYPVKSTLDENGDFVEKMNEITQESNTDEFHDNFLEFFQEIADKTRTTEGMPSMLSELIGRGGTRKFILEEDQIYKLLTEDQEFRSKMNNLSRKMSLHKISAFRNRFTKGSVLKFIFKINMDEGFCEY